ncbi:hypothetical protein AQUCO_00500437v1 [Aquilegia coerulea]|uniref:Cysteine-rich receptor-like protein kinase 10 n=1 Tax=Aquilegia coerulea TaxID=218851 RepID=A0A2G5ERX6_AQUCA|nr:hypothetical protein AQUCO_00500437v1 [Aquilegia coerulea]
MYVLSSTSKYLIILLPSFLLLHIHVQAEDPILQQCSNIANYTSNSQFETNLNLLLPSLLSNGTRDGFFNTSIGTAPDIVYGLVSCRGDLSMEQCRTCLYNATVEVFQRCPNRKEALLLYGNCILRYSNNHFFSKVDTNPRALYNTGKVSETDAAHFNQQLSNLLNNLSATAASRPSKFDSGRTDYIPFTKIESLVQCTRDLSATNCYSCLQSLITFIPSCCDRNQGGLFYTTTCTVRFEIYPFLQFQPQSFSPPFEASPPQSKAIPSPRVETSPTQSNIGTGKGKPTNVVTIVVPTICLLLLLAISAYSTHWIVRRNKRKRNPEINCEDDMANEQSLHFNLSALKTATKDFSDANKLGEGGFGAVYKGKLLDATEIAVKRLSKHSGQGSQEFKNEVLLLHKLQHRNLVRLLGFCLSGKEKLLIYEYLPNTSLDKYIFDPMKKAYLNWEMRYKIIEGIARGILYLHEDSRVKIIHRDLKAGNVLLDGEMNAKIADFGLAKLFGVDQSQGNTRRIAGTLGYMAPEYALHGLFSVKSDVFSFGVLLLEIISGKKSNDIYESGPSWNLLNYAWKLWREDNLQDRPTMSTVVMMLNSYSIILESPLAPAYNAVTRTDASGEMLSNNSASKALLCSVEGVSFPR